jgi:hypothetical protein
LVKTSIQQGWLGMFQRARRMLAINDIGILILSIKAIVREERRSSLLISEGILWVKGKTK